MSQLRARRFRVYRQTNHRRNSVSFFVVYNKVFCTNESSFFVRKKEKPPTGIEPATFALLICLDAYKCDALTTELWRQRCDTPFCIYKRVCICVYKTRYVNN